jgi:hypothetical protein
MSSEVEVNKPYRELALVPTVTEPATISPFSGRKCPKCGEDRYDSWHPFVTNYHAVLLQGGLCTGRKGGLFVVGCSEHRVHFHAWCRACGSRFLMAPADAT